MTFLIFFIGGLLAGSFLNVLVYRLRTAETLFLDRSKCPHCRNIIPWYDNIPVISFVLLKFRCRSCQGKISWQYPLVELGTGIVFAAVGMKFFSSIDPTTWFPVFFYLFVSGALIAILVYDWLYLEIPSLVLWPSVGAAIFSNLVLDWGTVNFGNNLLGSATYSGTLAGFVAFLFFFMLVSVSREKWMGMGDAYLVILLGLIVGWPQILLALFLAFAIGAVYGIILIVLQKKKMNSQLPFAPFLILGTFLTLFLYSPLTEWYFSWF